MNRQARGGGNSNCRWAGILIVADQCGLRGSNSARLRFPQRRFFGTPTSWQFYPSPPGKVEKSNINTNATTVVVHPPTPGYEFVQNSLEFLGLRL